MPDSSRLGDKKMWTDFELISCWLSRQRVPQGIRADEFDIATTNVVLAFLAVNGAVDEAVPWARTVLRHELGRARTRSHRIEGDCAEIIIDAAAPDQHLDAAFGRRWLATNRAAIRASLSSLELLVFDRVRAGDTRKQTMTLLRISSRNYSTIFARVIKKLRNLVPPPLRPVGGSDRLARKLHGSSSLQQKQGAVYRCRNYFNTKDCYSQSRPRYSFPRLFSGIEVLQVYGAIRDELECAADCRCVDRAVWGRNFAVAEA